MESDDLDVLKSRNIELEEQLKIFQNDLKTKDEHIKNLSSMEIRRSSSHTSDSIQSKAELASIQMQLSNVFQKLEESEINLKSKIGQVDELRSTNRNLNEQIENLSNLNTELQAKLLVCDKSSNEMECANSRSELAISTLQKELNNSLDQIVELEAQLKNSMLSQSNAEKSKETMGQKISEFYKDLNAHLNLESDGEPNVVFSKVKDLVTENNNLKGEIINLKAVAAEREQKYLETRESFRAVTQNFDKDKTSLEDYIRLKRDMTFEIEKLSVEKKSMELQNSELSKKVDDLEKLLHDTKLILDDKEIQLSKNYLEKRESSFTMANVSRELDSFKDSLAGLLGSSICRCLPTEEAIKERLRVLMSEGKEKENTICQLEMKLKNISEQYEKNYECSKENGLKARRVELEYLDLKDRIRQLEKELSSRDVTRDLLRAEKEKFYHFLRRLAAILRMDPYTPEHDLSLVFDGILNRTTQVVNSENERNIDTSQTINSLKKRLRDTKDQLHSRDLHLELMRKKLANQDEKVREAVEEANQMKDLMDNDNLKVKVSKMQKTVDSLRDENKALKADLFECSDIKTSFTNQNKELETLKHTVQKLERVRQKQAEKIAEYTKSMETYDCEANQTRIVSDNAIQSLTSEMKTLRSGLERARRSEKELLDFRAVVGKILGFNVEDLAIPNYEIIRRLEKLVSIPHSGVTVAVPIQHHPIRNCYEEANRLLGRKRISPIRTVFQDSGRPRSVSPIHEKRDFRKY